MNAEKTTLRNEIKTKKSALTSSYIAESDSGIYENLIKLPEFKKATVIFTYYSIGREPNTRKIIEFALENHKIVAIPVCAKCGVMNAHIITNTDNLVVSSLNMIEPPSSNEIVQPEEIDFVIVPALTYDAEGYRLGYGGGYYDRFLPRTRAFTVGLAREQLLVDTVPREAHDVAVCCVVTEKARVDNLET